MTHAAAPPVQQERRLRGVKPTPCYRFAVSRVCWPSPGTMAGRQNRLRFDEINIDRSGGRPGGSPGRARTIKAQSLPQGPGFDSCSWSFAACLPLSFPYLPVSLLYNRRIKEEG